MYFKIYQPIFLSVTILLIFLLSSCGADIESASGVEGMFSNVMSIQDKMNIICSDIDKDPEFKRSHHERFGKVFCSEAPSANVIDLNSVVDKKKKYAINEEIKTEDENTYIDAFRIEVYANTGLLEGAQKAVPTLKDFQKTDNADSPFNLTMKEKLKFDEKTITASAKFELVSTEDKNGYVYIKNDWKLYGKKVKNYFVATIDTTKVYKDSKLNKAYIMAAIIPHAGDIYINIIGQIYLQGAGVNGAMAAAISTMITETLYDIKQKFN